MRKIILFGLLVLSISCKKNKSEEIITAKPIVVSDNELVNYIEYCNNRFDICILYPSNFAPLPEPINGDGRTFTDDPDEAKITVYGSIVANSYNLENYQKNLESYVDVSEVINLPSGLEITGTVKDSDLVHHEIIILKEKERKNHKIKVMHNLTFTYPTAKEKKFKHYWDIISQKIRK